MCELLNAGSASLRLHGLAAIFLVMTKSGFLLQDRQTAGFLCHTSAAELVATATQVAVKKRDEWEVIQALRIV